MTELKPVAYMVRKVGETLFFESKPAWASDRQSTALYTEKNVYPRVKMTLAEFDEWKELYYRIVELSLTAYKMLNEILDSTHNSIGKYTELAKRVYQDNDFMSVSKKQAELVNLFVHYHPDNPEETIEIVPNKKWFVISKKRDGNERFSYIKSILSIQVVYGFSLSEELSEKEDYPYQFDTKEQAEEWTNPLTKAVLLPVSE